MSKIFVWVLPIFVWSCQPKEQNLQTTDFLTVSQKEKDTISFTEWFENTEVVINKTILKDTIIYDKESSDQIKINIFSIDKDRFALIDITQVLNDTACERKILFEQKNNQYLKKTSQDIKRAYQSKLGNDINIIDINFDQQKDIVIAGTIVTSGVILVDFDTFLQEQDSFYYSSDFSFQASDFKLNPSQKTITLTYFLGYASSKEVYKIERNKFKIIHSLVFDKHGLKLEEFNYPNQQKTLAKRWLVKNYEQGQKYFDNYKK